MKRERDEGRFENRADQFMRLEYVEERKRWGEEMRRRADGIVEGFGLDGSEPGDGMEWEGEGECEEPDSRALDEYISRELDENREQMQTEAGSFSDDEYDSLFMDLAGQGMDLSSG